MNKFFDFYENEEIDKSSDNSIFIESLIGNEEFEKLIRNIVQEELNKKENAEEEMVEQNRDIFKLGNLSLCYKTFADNVPVFEDELEICKIEESGWKYTIASFDYDDEDNCYILNSCGDRLDDNNINWEDFGKLVKKGYEILDKLLELGGQR